MMAPPHRWLVLHRDSLLHIQYNNYLIAISHSTNTLSRIIDTPKIEVYSKHGHTQSWTQRLAKDQSLDTKRFKYK